MQYSLNSGAISVAWEAGDAIALIHNGVKDIVKVYGFFLSKVHNAVRWFRM